MISIYDACGDVHHFDLIKQGLNPCDFDRDDLMICLCRAAQHNNSEIFKELWTVFNSRWELIEHEAFMLFNCAWSFKAFEIMQTLNDSTQVMHKALGTKFSYFTLLAKDDEWNKFQLYEDMANYHRVEMLIRKCSKLPANIHAMVKHPIQYAHSTQDLAFLSYLLHQEVPIDSSITEYLFLANCADKKLSILGLLCSLPPLWQQISHSALIEQYLGQLVDDPFKHEVQLLMANGALQLKLQQELEVTSIAKLPKL